MIVIWQYKFTTMKTLLLILGLVFTSQVIAQDVRTFYQSFSTGNYSTSMYEYNDDIYFVSIKDSSSAGIKIVSGKLDDQLNTSNYRQTNVVVPSFAECRLSGSAVNGNLLLLGILGITSNSRGKMNYVTIDLTDFSIVSNVVNEDEYIRSFVRSFEKNGHLVTYILGYNNNILYRLDNDIVSLATSSSEIADSASAVYANSFYDHIGFDIYSEVEFVQTKDAGSTKSKVIKRTNLGVYSNQLLELQYNSIRKFLKVLPNGNVFVSNPMSYCILNQNLDSLTSGDFPAWTVGSLHPNSRWLLQTQGNAIHDYRPLGKKYIYDLDMNLVDSVFYDRNILPEGIFTTGNDKYLYGQVRNPVIYNRWKSDDFQDMDDHNKYFDIFLIKNCSNEPFVEYNQVVNHNNIFYETGACGTSFFNRSLGKPGYRYSVDDQEVGTIFYKTNPVIGMNEGGDHLGTKGIFNMNTDLLNGPVYTSVNDFNEQMDKYNRGYYVTREMIEQHLAVLYYGNPDYVPDFGIMNWPAHGNILNGEAENLADFVDNNSNGIYEPMLGDYPKIYGDQCVLNIYHQDPLNPYGNHLEFHQYLFTYDCDTAEVLKNSVFENLRVINRGGDLDSTVIGSFIDYDLGGPNDDFVGTNVELGMIYTYNADTLDLTDGHSLGFNDKIPAQGMIVLNGMNLAPNGSDNPFGVANNQSINGNGFGDGVVDNEYLTLETSMHYTNGGGGIYSDPTTELEFWHVLNGRFKDGSERLFAPGVPMRYSFYGTSDPLFYATRGVDHGNNQSEFSFGITPGDRRIMGGSGPGFFASGDTINYITAHITSFDSTDVTVPISTDKLFADAAWLKTAFANNDLGCGKNFGPIQNDLSLQEVEKYNVSIYPNPFTNEIIISNLSQETSTIQIYNLEGKSVYSDAVVGMNVVVNLDLQPGLYIVKVSNNHGTATKRIVRN